MDVVAACAGLVAGVVAGAVGARLAGIRRRAAMSLPLATGGATSAPPPAVVHAALDASLTGVVVLDAAGDVAWTNPAADTMRVVSERSLHPSDLARLARRAQRERVPVHADVDLSDAVHAVHVVAVPAGAFVALLLDDTTDARRVDAVRRDFVANVSHELKTPVGAMSLLAEAIQESGDDPDAVRRFADRILVESARLSRLVGELIDLSRLQGAEPMRAERVLVRSFVDDAVDRTRLAASLKDIEVAVHLADPELAVRGDAALLATAVGNLVDNAVAYSPAGTRVTIAARQRRQDVEVAVTDQGIGISASDRERVFERFYRVDPARSRETGGTGLGLAIVKHIAGNHGGRVEVWSVEGTGSTFTLTLPAAQLEPAMEGAAS